MALATGSLFQIQATATTGNTGGAGFNPGNANFLTDATATSATGNAPVISSASYNFAAGDVGAWIYIKAGTNWTPGFYQISSVAANAATVNATIGAALQLVVATNLYEANTVAGVATVASPSGGTFGVDYSQSDTAKTTATDFTSVGASSTLTSATATFTVAMVGNFFHQTTAGTGAHGLLNWFEIVSFTNATTVVLDRTSNDGTASVACTGFVGGAGRLNGLEDAFGEMLPASATVYIKNGTYTFSAAVAIASTNSTTTNPIMLMGFNTLRGDTCTGSNRPVFAMAANGCALGPAWILRNIQITSTSANAFTMAVNSKAVNVRVTNSSTTPTRICISTANASNTLTSCEMVSQNGTGLSTATVAVRLYGCYIHDSSTGVLSTTGAINAFNCIFEACDSVAVNSADATISIFINNTFYGREGKTTTGIAFTGASSTGKVIANNIFYGFVTALNFTTLQPVDLQFVNDFFNNTTDCTNIYKSKGSLALDPQFLGATQITGSTATTAASVLTQSGGDFSTVTDNVDYLHVLSGTGVTTGIYLITSHTGTTLTVNNALGTSSGGDVVYYVTTGHNFGIGSNLKAVGTPSLTTVGAETTNYIDVGAAQAQSSSGGGAFSSTYAG